MPLMTTTCSLRIVDGRGCFRRFSRAGWSLILLRYYPPVVTTPFDGVKAREWWVKEIQRGLGGVPWLKNPEGNPRRMQAGLREAAFPLDGLARTALLLPEHRDELTMHVRAGADWLIKLQHSSGVFPFPVGP